MAIFGPFLGLFRGSRRGSRGRPKPPRMPSGRARRVRPGGPDAPAGPPCQAPCGASRTPAGAADPQKPRGSGVVEGRSRNGSAKRPSRQARRLIARGVRPRTARSADSQRGEQPPPAPPPCSPDRVSPRVPTGGAITHPGTPERSDARPWSGPGSVRALATGAPGGGQGDAHPARLTPSRRPGAPRPAGGPIVGPDRAAREGSREGSRRPPEGVPGASRGPPRGVRPGDARRGPGGPPGPPPRGPRRGSREGSRGAARGPGRAPGAKKCTFFWVFNNSPIRDRKIRKRSTRLFKNRDFLPPGPLRGPPGPPRPSAGPLRDPLGRGPSRGPPGALRDPSGGPPGPIFRDGKAQSGHMTFAIPPGRPPRPPPDPPGTPREAPRTPSGTPLGPPPGGPWPGAGGTPRRGTPPPDLPRWRWSTCEPRAAQRTPTRLGGPLTDRPPPVGRLGAKREVGGGGSRLPRSGPTTGSDSGDASVVHGAERRAPALQ